MKKKYWILTITRICLTCGRISKYRERRFEKKPKDFNSRNKVKEHYNYCELFY